MLCCLDVYMYHRTSLHWPQHSITFYITYFSNIINQDCVDIFIRQWTFMFLKAQEISSVAKRLLVSQLLCSRCNFILDQQHLISVFVWLNFHHLYNNNANQKAKLPVRCCMLLHSTTLSQLRMLTELAGIRIGSGQSSLRTTPTSAWRDWVKSSTHL